MQLTVNALAAACGGRVVGDGDVVVNGASHDSRGVGPGQLFVPVVGERDGHQFIADAVAAGAAAYLTARPPDAALAAPAILVDDTVAALAALGGLARSAIGDRVVGVTGSVGKTSVKDLTAAVLGARWPTAAALRSFNNELGVPLTLLNAADGTEAAVVEMGARGLGHIAALCRIARPTVGIVTMVGAAHLELFGSLDDVARGKGELVEALPANGWAVLNADDERVAAMASRTAAQVVTFGTAGDVTAEDVVVDDELRPRFRLVCPWGGVAVALGVRGAHMVANALAAAAAGLALGLAVDEVAAGLEGAALSPWRMEVARTAAGTLVINDAYNANPVSMRAGLEALAALAVPPGGRRIAVLGVMAELGPDAADAHRDVARRADELGLELWAVGTDAYGVEPLADRASALARLQALQLGQADALLVKASRVAGLEQLAQGLLAP